jgi:hypothetical protein
MITAKCTDSFHREKTEAEPVRLAFTTRSHMRQALSYVGFIQVQLEHFHYTEVRGSQRY